MAYIILLIPIILIIALLSSLISLHKRINQLEQKIDEGYSPIIGDIHQRLEVLEQERRN